MQGFEADDIIGTVAKNAEKNGFEVYMVTPDKDFAQLVTENIFLYKPARFGNGIEIMGVDEVNKKFEIDAPVKVIDYLGMMGDSVDNIPGIPGVGDKTAKKFIKDYGSIEGLYENTHELKGKLKEKVEENHNLAMLSKKLATIITDVPIAYELENLKISKPSSEQIISIFDELEFKRLKESYFKLFSNSDVKTEIKQTDIINENRSNFITQKISGKTGILILKQKIRESKLFAFDSKFYGNDSYLCLCWSAASTYFIKVEKGQSKELLSSFKEIFESYLKKVVFNHKAISKILYDMILKSIIFLISKLGHI